MDVRIKRMEVAPDLDFPYRSAPFAYEVIVTMTVRADSHADAMKTVQDRLMEDPDARS